MLVLSRKVGEAIVLDDKTIVTIKEITKDGVKLAVEAPREVKILRKELVDSVKEENQAATMTFSPSAMKSLLKPKKKDDE